MTTREFVQLKHGYADRKGTEINVPGPNGGITLLDLDGKTLAKGFTLRLGATKTVQPDPSKAPFTEINIHVQKATAEGKRERYIVTQPFERLINNFPDVVKEAVGPDAEFQSDDPYHKLLLLVLALSSDRPDLAPVVTTDSWMEPDGWYVRGKKVSSAPVEVNREFKDPESNAVRYVLRAPRLTGEGWEYSKPITWEEFLAGHYGFSDGRSLNVVDPTQAFMAISERWDGLSHSDRLRQEREEETQPERDLQT
jgi:hypothetical protein